MTIEQQNSNAMNYDERDFSAYGVLPEDLRKEHYTLKETAEVLSVKSIYTVKNYLTRGVLKVDKSIEHRRGVGRYISREQLASILEHSRGYLTTPQFARKCGTTAIHISALVREGKLKSKNNLTKSRGYLVHSGHLSHEKYHKINP